MPRAPQHLALGIPTSHVFHVGIVTLSARVVAPVAEYVTLGRIFVVRDDLGTVGAKIVHDSALSDGVGVEQEPRPLVTLAIYTACASK